MKRISALAVFLIFILQSHGQTKQVINQQLYWLRYYHQLSLSKKWNWHNEFEERRFFVNNRHHHFIAHSRLNYKLSKTTEAGLGFAYSLQDPQDPRATTTLTVPEYRPYQELNYLNSINKRFSLSQRFRIDERFVHKNDGTKLQDGFDFNFRFRYRLQFNYRLNYDEQKKSTVLKLSDELMINEGKNIIYNHFDQNRIYLGLEKTLDKHFSAELGYLYWFQQKSNGYQFYDRDIFRLTLYQKMSL